MAPMIPNKKDYTLVIHCNYDTYLQFINTYLKAKRMKKFKNHEQFLLSMLHLYENAMISERLRP